LKTARTIPFAGSTALAPISAIVHLLFHILTVMDLGREKRLPIADATDASGRTALINARSHWLHVPFAQPTQLDREWAALDHTGFPGAEQFPCFRRRTRHQGTPILIAYIDKHGGCKPSLRSKVLLTIVAMAFYDLHTFRFRVPLM